jgi:hypothetical protein
MGRRRGFWILVVLFLALAAWLRYGPRPAATPAGPAPFIAIEPTRVRSLLVRFDRDTTLMEREDGRWWITKPLRFPADPVAVEALLNRTRALVPRGLVPNDRGAGGGDPFGVDDPLVVVELGLTDGSSVRLDFGNVSPAAQAFYVRATGRDSLALISEAEADTYFRKPLDSWRDPALFTFKPEEALEVRLERPGGRVTLARTGDGRPWQVLEPFAGRADDAVVDEYVTSLRAMKARSFLEAAPPGAFDAATRRIVIGVAGRRDTLLLSAHADAGRTPQVPARLAGRPWTYGVPQAYLAVADRSDLTFRDRRFVHQPLRSLGGLRAVSGRDSIEFQPDSTGAWRRVGETGTPGAPPPDRTPLVDAWVRTAADSIVAAGDPLDPFRSGATPPATRFTVLLYDADGRRLADWEIRPRPGGRDGFAARDNHMDPPRPGEVLLVPSDLVLPLLAILAGR